MPDTFTLLLDIKDADTDHLGHVNNLVYLQWAAAISKQHWEHLADEAVRKPFIWVMGRQEIDYLQELKPPQQVKMETFVERTEKHKCFRTVLFYNNQTGVLAAKAQIIWVLLDAVSKRPMRISENLCLLFERGK